MILTNSKSLPTQLLVTLAYYRVIKIEPRNCDVRPTHKQTMNVINSVNTMTQSRQQQPQKEPQKETAQSTIRSHNMVSSPSFGNHREEWGSFLQRGRGGGRENRSAG